MDQQSARKVAVGLLESTKEGGGGGDDDVHVRPEDRGGRAAGSGRR